MKRIKSLWLLVVIFMQKMWDLSYRYIMGIPTLKRSQITANLFLGGQYNLRGLRRLKEMGITAIINMRIHSIYEAARYQGFAYLHLPTTDNTPPSIEALIQGSDFAHEHISKGGKVYIHCRQGLGRGPSMAIAYLMKMGATFPDALAAVKAVRTFINPRPSQIKRLQEFEVWLKEHDQVVKKAVPKV